MPIYQLVAYLSRMLRRHDRVTTVGRHLDDESDDRRASFLINSQGQGFRIIVEKVELAS